MLVVVEYKMTAFQRASRLRLVIFDVDGVLTDGGVYIGAGGELMKRFCIKDGMGITLLRRGGIKTAIITGRRSEIVQQRAEELRIDIVRQGCQDKRLAYRELKKELSLSDEEIGYIGDDLLDLPVLLQAGFSAAPADAAAEIREAAQLVTGEKGGYGAVREISEFILKAQNKWEELIAGYKNTSITETPA